MDEHFCGKCGYVVPSGMTSCQRCGSKRMKKIPSSHAGEAGFFSRILGNQETGEHKIENAQRENSDLPHLSPDGPRQAKQEEVKNLRNSSLLFKFVRQQNAAWNHQDWLDFLASARAAGYLTLTDDELGNLLEQEKARFISNQMTSTKQE